MESWCIQAKLIDSDGNVVIATLSHSRRFIPIRRRQAFLLETCVLIITILPSYSPQNCFAAAYCVFDAAVYVRDRKKKVIVNVVLGIKYALSGNHQPVRLIAKI